MKCPFALLTALWLALPSIQAAAQSDEVRAESFGFNAVDATPALQRAINSGAKRVVVGNTGRPWIIKPIKLRGDLELVFEKGVEIVAMRGEFRAANASLFAARNARNLTIRGAGNVLRMWKSDYQNPPYAKSEWRHALSFHGCEKVTVENLTLADSGGDGLYLGTGESGGCRRFTIRDVLCRNHHRQGISVINAEDLLIERCRFSDTAGTAPMAGIDFEPNASGERLKNCVLRHCTFDRNASAGVLFAISKLDAASEPVSITLEACTIRGNLRPVHLSPRNPAGVGGGITFVNCVFADSPKGSVLLERKTLPGARVIFDRCKFKDLATELKDSAPIAISCRQEQGDPLGGIDFKGCVVEDALDRQPLVYDDLNGVRLRDINGTLTVSHAGTTKTITLTQELIDQWFPWSADLRNYARYDLRTTDLKKNANASGAASQDFGGWLRGEAMFAIVAEAPGSQLSFKVTTNTVGKNARTAPIPVKVISPSGKIMLTRDAGSSSSTTMTVTAEEAGVHRIEINPNAQIVNCVGVDQPVNAISLAGAFHFLGGTERLYFLVPAGVREFALRVAGDGGREQARAQVFNARGELVADEDDIARVRQIVITRPEASLPEGWSFQLLRPTDAIIEDVHVLLDGVPAVLAPSASALLVPEGTASLGLPR